ncbi:MAG: tyrosine-type recombinase/integrase, partial [Candidatus Dormibacteria bacterium]
MPDGRYRAKISFPDGTRRSHRARTKEEAEKWLNEQTFLIRQGTIPAQHPETVAEFGHRWLEAISLEAAKGKTTPPRPNTMDGYRRKIENYFIRSLGRYRMSDLTRDHITALYSWVRAGNTLPNRLGVPPDIRLSRNGDPLKAQGLVHFHRMLKPLFERAMIEGVIT